MSGNFQKTPFADSQNVFASRKAQDALAITGKALPASVAAIPTPGVPVVTVKFEVQDPVFTTLPNVTMPVLGSEYVRIPLQAPNGATAGTQGVVIAADAYLGGVSGLGGGTASLVQRGNLSTLYFVPLGNKNWVAVNPNSTVIYGATGGGTTIQDTVSPKSTITTTATGIAEAAPQITMNASNGASTFSMTNSAITLACGGHSIVINSTGVIIDGKVFLLHTHLDELTTTGPVA